jgi:hypothetical protein
MLATIALPEGVTLTAAGEQVPLLALDLLTRWKALDLIGDDRVETDDVLADWFASVGVDPSLPMRHWVNRPNNDYVDEDPLTAAAGDGDAEDGHAGGGHAGEAVAAAAAAADGPPLDGVLDALEQTAYGWYRQAVELDPEWPNYDDTISDTTEQAEYQGHAAGLRQAAVELLRAIHRGRPCANCKDPVGDPQDAPATGGALCRGCADPA